MVAIIGGAMVAAAVNVIKLGYSSEEDRFRPPVLTHFSANGEQTTKYISVSNNFGNRNRELAQTLCNNLNPNERTAIIIEPEQAINCVQPNTRFFQRLSQEVKSIQEQNYALFNQLDLIISGKNGVQITQRDQSPSFEYPSTKLDPLSELIKQKKFKIGLDSPDVITKNYLKTADLASKASDKKLSGDHFIIEICDADFSNDKKVLGAFREVVGNTELTKHDGTKGNLKVLGEREHLFTPQGASSVILLEESHASIHTWPEDKYAAVDLYTCSPGRDMMPLIERLQKEFGGVIQVRKIERGSFTN